MTEKRPGPAPGVCLIEVSVMKGLTVLIMIMIMIIIMTLFFNGQRQINCSPLEDKITNLMKKLTATMKISK